MMQSSKNEIPYVAGSFTFYNLSYAGHGGKKHKPNAEGLPQCGARIKNSVHFTGRQGNLELCSKCRPSAD